MVMAQLRGKMNSSAWLTQEDWLTGAVLGALKNLDPSLTTGLLRRAVALDGKATPQLVAEDLAWEFWPWWGGCEPDVVIQDTGTMCVIEVKYLSGFGDGAPQQRQLAREWRQGLARANKDGKDFWLIALTKHGTLPKMEIEYQMEAYPRAMGRVAWLSWTAVARAIGEATDAQAGGWRDDLAELLTRMGITPFAGFLDIVATFGRAQASDLAWAVSDVLPNTDAASVGFAGLLGSVESLRYGIDDCWRPRLRVPAKAVGFEATIDIAGRLMAKECDEWLLRI